MNIWRKWLYIFLFLSMPLYPKSNSREHRLANAATRFGAWIATPITAATGLFVAYGEGKQAKEQLAQTNKILESNNSTTEKMASAINQNAQELQNATQGIYQISEGVTNVKESVDTGFDKVLQYENINTAMGVITMIGSCIYIAGSAKDFYHYMFPTKEEIIKKQMDKELVIKQLAVLRAERPMNRCLAIHAKSPRGEDGLPLACKNECLMYALATSPDEINKIRRDFIECYGPL